MTGVIYARYSEGPRQTDQSIEGQVDDCRAFAEQKGIQIVEIYADRHVSGKSVDGRDEFQRMMSDADKHKFDCIIVWKIDRFGRNREDIALGKIRLRKAKVQLMYAKEAVPDGPEGILLESLLEGLAEYYSADLQQKVTRGLDESARKGKWPCSALPIGYKKDPEQRIVIDEERADLVREVFRMHLAGDSQQAMQRYLYDHGVLDRKGKAPVQAVVYRMLRNRRYTGEFVYHGIKVPAPAIIDSATFDEAQRHFKGRNQNAAGKAKVDFLLSCKCHCAYCGRLLDGESGTSKTGRTYYYYKCSTKKHGGKCELAPVPQDRLEDLVISHTIDDVLTEVLIDRLTDEIMALQEKQRAEDPATQLRQRLKENRKRQENLVAALEAGGSRALTSRLSDLEAEEDQLVTNISRAEIRHPMIPADAVRGWLESFRKGDVHSKAFRDKLVRTFVDDVVVANDAITIFYNIKNESLSNSSTTTRYVDFVKWYSNTTTPGPWVFNGYIVLRIAV